MSRPSYLIVEPGMGWLDNALPEVLVRKTGYVFIFFRLAVYRQCLTYIKDQQAISSSAFYSGSFIPSWFAFLVKKIPLNKWLIMLGHLFLHILFECLSSFARSSINLTKSNLVFADFANAKVYESRHLKKFRDGTWVHVDHGLNLWFSYSREQLKSLDSCSYFLCWTSSQSSFFETHFGSSRVVRGKYQKLSNPVFWNRQVSRPQTDRKKIIFISRPPDPLYISASELEQKLLCLIKVCSPFGFDLLIQQHPKEVGYTTYSRYLGTSDGVGVSLFEGQLSDLSGFQVEFAIAIYTGTVFETLTQGIPNIQLASSGAVLARSVLRQYIDSGVTQEFSSGSWEELAGYFDTKDQILKKQTGRMNALLHG